MSSKLIKTTIVCACGHEVEFELRGPRAALLAQCLQLQDQPCEACSDVWYDPCAGGLQEPLHYE